MKDLENYFFADESSFRKWLNENHDKSPGIWMIFYKKQTGTECIKYPEALDTALCFGWIDSIIKKVDETQYARKFTPRTNVSKWSEFNKRRVGELIRNGKMTEAGLSKIDSYLKTGEVKWSVSEKSERRSGKFQIPRFIIDEFAGNEPALTNFNGLPPYQKRYYVLWITDAKMDITIKKRLKESVMLLKENKKLGLK